jgi:hypothetical protein
MVTINLSFPLTYFTHMNQVASVMQSAWRTGNPDCPTSLSKILPTPMQQRTPPLLLEQTTARHSNAATRNKSTDILPLVNGLTGREAPTARRSKPGERT